MRILILNTHTPYTRGGAEIHAEGLLQALTRRGHQADLLRLPCTYHPDRMLDEMLAARCYDLSRDADLVIGFKFPAYLCRHPNKILWLLHQNRHSYDLWHHPEYQNGINWIDPSLRQAIRRADEIALAECRRIYTNSKTVSARLESFCGLDSQPLYPPLPGSEAFYHRPAEDFFFFPSRIDLSKRQSLALEALALSRPEVRLLFAGGSPNQHDLERLKKRSRELGLEQRAVFLGVISEQQKLDYYARCRGVVFPTYDEDFGYISLEGMLSSKPVIVCCDSGGATELVLHEQTGLICEPKADALAEAMSRLWTSPHASEWGRNGRERSQQVVSSWDQVVDQLLEGLLP